MPWRIWAGNTINWDELFEKLDKKDKKYEEWRDFQRRILKPAQEELKEKSDIRFEYEGIREGRKTRRLLFTIYRNVPKNQEVISERQKIIEANVAAFRQLEMPMDTFPDLYGDFVGHNKLTKEDIDLLLKKADYQEERVRGAIAMADAQDSLTNYMGWLIRCIEKGYGQVETVAGSAQREKNKDIIVARAWERTKSKEDYDEFIGMIEKNGLTEELLESIYPVSETLQMYADWKAGREIKF